MKSIEVEKIFYLRYIGKRKSSCLLHLLDVIKVIAMCNFQKKKTVLKKEWWGYEACLCNPNHVGCPQRPQRPMYNSANILYALGLRI